MKKNQSKAKVTQISKYQKNSRPVKKKVSEGKKRIVKKKKKSNKLILLILLILFINGTIIGLIMYRYSIISTLNYKHQNLNKIIEKNEDHKKELLYQLERNQSNHFIEKQAKEILNMQYPRDDQTVYLEVE